MNSELARDASQMFRDWSEISYVEAIFAILVAIVSVAAIRYAVPKVASWLPDRLRIYILPWEPILRLLVLATAILYVLLLFIEPTPEKLLSIAGAMALALGFAFKDYASSLVAGVVALYERPYRAGDWIEINGVYGEVLTLGLRTVRLVTPDDSIVAVPHGKMWNSLISNSNSGLHDLMRVVDFYLHPEHDGRLVRDGLRDIALSSAYLNPDRPVTVIATEEPWGTHYRLKAYPLAARYQFQIATDLTLRGKEFLSRNGVRPTVAPLGYDRKTPA
jgi:small-conductance mechanosensitive channel